MKKFNLADWALRHKSIIYYFIAVLLTFGIFSFTHMGRMEDPDFTMRTMVVGVSWPGASPQQMSDQVTDKLEEKLRDLPGVDYTKSFTDGSKSVIYINLKEDLPSNKIRPAWEEARNMINDEWKSLPSGVQGPSINDRFDDVYGTIYALSGDEFSYEEKRQQAENLKRQLLSVPNVKKITLIGVQEKSLDVTINKDKLASYQVSTQQLLTALKQQSAMVPAGMVNTDTNNVYLRINGVFDSVDAVKNMPIRINNQTIRLGDIADVTMTYKDPSSPQFYYEGKPAIGIAISMDAGANNIEFGKSIDTKLKELKTTIPAGLNLDQVSNQPHIVKESIGDFSQSLFEAIAIVLLVSFASLGIRTGIVVALTIPVVVSTTFVLMYENGIYLHKVSLGALILALGLLVDDAIIVVEMMSVKLEEGFNHWRASTFAYESTAFPMLSGTLITCAGFLPLALAEGMVAEFTKSLSIVVFMALILSWIASVLVSPVLGYKIIENKAEKPESEWTRRDHIMHRLKTVFYARFESLLHWALGHHKAVLLLTLGAFILSLLSFPLIKQEFFPSSTRNEIIISMQFPQSSSIDYTQNQAKSLDALLKDNEHIDHFTTYVGEGSPRFVLTLEPELPRANFMQTIIVTKSLEDRDALFKDLQDQLNDQYPSALINMQFVQIGPPSKYPVMLRVSGPDASEVKTIANDVKAKMQEDKDLHNIAFDWPDTEPVAQIHIDPDKARMLGINSYAVSLHLQSLLSGTKSGEYYEGNQTIPVTFRLSGNENHNLAALSSLPIQTGNGSYVPLSQIATISMSQEEGIIWHRNMMPTISIHANVGPGVLGNAKTKEIYNKLAEYRQDLPTGYTIDLDGSAEKSVTAVQKLLMPMPIMLFAIMTILMFQLKRIALMFMALFTAPLGLIGVVLALNITRTPLGFMAILGIIALSGMIIRNSIILLDQIEIHRAEGQSAREAIINSATLRFRPIMLTAIAAILGMIPLMGSVFWSPLAIAFSGGLLVATILTLIVLPVMYATWYKVK
ncbi:Cobalt-zinc-cadmium resistance protein CzcA [Veillonella atypica]|uniref:RND transporter, HAE1/HME family, permease protein n=3 Tax=Veillonella TaxID=29465 RepID=A0A133S064_9FIRM|nr:MULTISPECIES: efflux RND transporter permease subunit [Veillonella]EFL58505.1 RND transporter, HAE1/HME family, permease protein [Veillonella atypica ACS-134-V-Col7a]KXA61432.1 RND transporter, HAE1/HME family, permease protein [Veillonella atypica]MDU7875971.1 efflux RND transporter permease subunit [Veillonella sp.]MDU7936350.1 efflux RND transporter permease subunit [Veillonella sp.]